MSSRFQVESHEPTMLIRICSRWQDWWAATVVEIVVSTAILICYIKYPIVLHIWSRYCRWCSVSPIPETSIVDYNKCMKWRYDRRMLDVGVLQLMRPFELQESFNDLNKKYRLEHILANELDLSWSTCTGLKLKNCAFFWRKKKYIFQINLNKYYLWTKFVSIIQNLYCILA